MKKVPISLIVDDPAPLVHIYREHRVGGDILPSGERLLPDIPTEFLERFCDTVETYGIRGKFSIVPMPGCRGDILNGVDNKPEETKRWLNIAKTRLTPYFAICPEVLTHHKAVNLDTGGFYEENEKQWAAKQNRASLARYIGRALEIHREAGLDPSGLTSPWTFGIEVEDDYVAALCDAYDQVLGKKKSWYFLHSDNHTPGVKPRVRYREGDRCVVEVISTNPEAFWDSIECQRSDEAYVSEIADILITADGQKGAILDCLARDAYPIVYCHWQSLFSNGRESGLRALGEVARRVAEHLSDVVEWQNFNFLMDEAILRDTQ